MANLGLREVADNVGENVADDGTQEQQNGDDDDGDEHQDQRVLYQTLAFFTWKEQHVFSPLSGHQFGRVCSGFSASVSNHYTRKRQFFQESLCKISVNFW